MFRMHMARMNRTKHNTSLTIHGPCSKLNKVIVKMVKIKHNYMLTKPVDVLKHTHACHVQEPFKYHKVIEYAKSELKCTMLSNWHG